MKYLLITVICLLTINSLAQLKLDTNRSFEQNFHDLYNPWMRYGTFIPSNMDECVIVLKSLPNYSHLLIYNKEEMYNMLFEEKRFSVHRTWDLEIHSVLSQYFYRRGIYSVDKMEALILYSYYLAETDCSFNFDEIIAQIAKYYKKSEGLAYKLLIEECKHEYKFHKKIQRKSKREYKKSIKMANKGDEFDLFFD